MAVKVTGKYLTLFDNFSHAWNPEDWYRSSIENAYRRPLAAAIAGMHVGVLDIADAENLITSLVIDVHVESRRSGQDLQAARASLAAELVAYVESLPRRYCLTVGLPDFPDWWTEADVRVAEDIAFVRRVEAPLNSLTKIAQAVAATGSPSPVRSPVTLRISVEGFGDFASHAPAVGKAISLAKQTAYLLQAYGIVEGWGVATRSAEALWKCESRPEIEAADMAPPSLSRMFSPLRVREDGLQVFDAANGQIGKVNSLFSMYESRAATTPDEKNQALDSKLGGLRSALAAREKPDYRTVAAAMEWYQDSTTADNETVAFISACIGVEALIGTQEQENQMSDRLSDRYAFMMGTNRAERVSLREEFRGLLSLRGKLGKVCKTPSTTDDEVATCSCGAIASDQSIAGQNSGLAAASSRIADALIPGLAAVAGASSTDCPAQTASSAAPCSWPARGNAPWHSRTAA